MKRLLCPALALTLITGAGAAGAPLDAAWINPTAGWLVHLDLEGIFKSQSLRELTRVAGVNLDEIDREMHIDLTDEIKIDGKEIPPHVLEAWRNMEFKVSEDIKSITAFGPAGDDEPELVVLRTSNAVDEIIATLDPIEGVSVTPGEQVSFVALRPVTEGGEPAMPDQVLAIRKELGDERTIVISETTQGLVRAMDSYATQQRHPSAPAWTSMRPGSFLLMHVTGEALAGMDHDESEILERAREIRLEVGESGAGEVYADALIEADDAEIVNQISAIANGLLAMGRLMLASEPEGQHVISLINALRITTDQTTMRVEFRMDSATLGETLGALKELEVDHDAEDQEVEIHIEVGGDSDQENL